MVHAPVELDQSSPESGGSSMNNAEGRSRHRRAALAGLLVVVSGCHAIKTQLGMNAGATSGSAPSGSSEAPAASGSSSSSGKKAHLGGGDRGAPGLLETLGRPGHDGHDASGFDASPYDVSPPRFVWRTHSGPAQDRAGKHRF
jgi:hypothetical protein